MAGESQITLGNRWERVPVPSIKEKGLEAWPIKPLKELVGENPIPQNESTSPIAIRRSLDISVGDALLNTGNNDDLSKVISSAISDFSELPVDWIQTVRKVSQEVGESKADLIRLSAHNMEELGRVAQRKVNMGENPEKEQIQNFLQSEVSTVKRAIESGEWLFKPISGGSTPWIEDPGGMLDTINADLAASAGNPDEVRTLQTVKRIFSDYNDDIDPTTETARSLDVLREQLSQAKVTKPDIIEHYLDQVSAYRRANRPALDAVQGALNAEARSASGIITSEMAEDRFNRSPDKVGYVRARIDWIRGIYKSPDEFRGTHFVPYEELVNAEAAIQAYSPRLWLEEQYTFPMISVGMVARGANEMTDILQQAGKWTAEFFQTMTRLPLTQAATGSNVEAVAKGFSLLERYKVEYMRLPRENKSELINVVSWMIHGYSEADSRARAAANMKAPYFSAAMDAEDLWLGTLRGIVPAKSGTDVLRESIVYPAYRLANIQSSVKANPEVLRFFKEEGNKYVDPFFVDFWTYLAFSKPERIGLPTGMLQRTPSGGYRMENNLQNVNIASINFQADMKPNQFFSKYLAYATNADKFRALAEKGGVFTNPRDMEVLSKHIADGLWNKQDYGEEGEIGELRAAAICNVAEGIVEFNKRSFNSPAKRDIKGSWPDQWDHKTIKNQLNKLTAPPFNISPNSRVFNRLKKKYAV